MNYRPRLLSQTRRPHRRAHGQWYTVRKIRLAVPIARPKQLVIVSVFLSAPIPGEQRNQRGSPSTRRNLGVTR